MIENIKPFYRERAAQLFQIVDVAVVPLSPLALSFVDEDPEAALSVTEVVISDAEIQRRHNLVSKRLKNRCAGLIEIGQIKELDAKENVPWKPSRVQFLHLTVKEFLASAEMRNWLVTQSSATTPNTHVQILSCYLRQLKITGCAAFYRYDDEQHLFRLTSLYVHINHGLIFSILFHALQAERLILKSQLVYLETLDELVRRLLRIRLPVDDKETFSDYNPKLRHWTACRYPPDRDWVEPDNWQSDYVSYLVSIGMTRAVIEKLRMGYTPSLKSGMPLLCYAVFSTVPNWALGRMERDIVSPELIEELLKRGCDPNQSFKRLRGYEFNGMTVWECVLIQAWRRLYSPSPSTIDEAEYYEKLSKDEAAMIDLRLRWVKTFRLFLEYGADIKILANVKDSRGRDQVQLRMSALSIFNNVFEAFDHPLVPSTRELLISKGGTVVKGVVNTNNAERAARKGIASRFTCCCSLS
jgi:hypothetical protein